MSAWCRKHEHSWSKGDDRTWCQKYGHQWSNRTDGSGRYCVQCGLVQ